MALPLVACNDFLTREPFDRLRADNDETWNSEDVVKYSMYNVYPTFFKGYNSSWGRADWFAETDIADWNDDNAQEKATFFTKNVPTTTSSTNPWNFEMIHTIGQVLTVFSVRWNTPNLCLTSATFHTISSPSHQPTRLRFIAHSAHEQK